MTYNQPYQPSNKLALYFVYKVVFWVVVLVSEISFAQFFIADSTIITFEGEVFICEEVREENKTIIYIAQGTKLVNFPVEDDFVVIDENKFQGVDSKEVQLSHFKSEPENLVEESQSTKSKVETNDFFRIEKSSDRTVLSGNHSRAVGVVQANPDAQPKILLTEVYHDLGLYFWQ